MSTHGVTVEPGVHPDDPRDRLLADLPVTQHTLHLAGIPTAVLAGGSGPPLILLHGPCANVTHWMDLLPELVGRFRVLAPDLPGHGASGTVDPLDGALVLDWLDALVGQAGPDRPALLGHAMGGAIAARYAADRSDRLRALILVDTFGLVPLCPAAEFTEAVADFLADPTDATHDRLWRFCALDLGRLRERVAQRWAPFRSYNVARARTEDQRAATGALMAEFGWPPIPAAQLHRISAPTTLVWGRGDLATPLAAAEHAAGRYGWGLEVIDDCADDPPVEAPAALLRAAESAAGVLVDGRSRP